MIEHRQDPEQKIQEDEYSFPYHYIVQNREGFSQWFSDGWGINYLATIEFLLERLSGETFDSAVDIGCGDGRFTKELAEAFPGKKIMGVDYSARAIALARAMTPDVDYRHADITAGEITEDFDVAVLMEVYEHIPPDVASRFVEAIANLLVPRGLLYVTVPHVNKPVEPKHYRHFTVSSIRKEFDSRFELLEVIPIEKRSRWKSLIDFILANPLFALNNRRIGGLLYSRYRKRLFLAGSESRCKRIVLRLRKR